MELVITGCSPYAIILSDFSGNLMVTYDTPRPTSLLDEHFPGDTDRVNYPDAMLMLVLDVLRRRMVLDDLADA